VFVIDVGTQRVTREVQLPLPTGYVVAVPQVTLSPSGDGLYLGLGAYLHGDLVHATTILGVDTATWQKTTTERTPAFSAFRVANDGSRIFAVNEKSPTLGVVGLRPVTGYVPFGTVAGRPLAIFTTAAPTQASVPSGVTSYHAPAGWTIGLPAGWQAVPFSTSKEGATAVGVQLSNVTLPPPTMVPGYPIQTNGRVLPSDGVSLIIGTDQDPRDVQQPPQPPRPLPVPPLYNLAWRMGSAGSDSPYVQLLWFEWNRQIYIASAKVGPQSTPDERAALDEIILSLRFPSITPSASGMGISGPLIGGSYVTLTQAQGIARVPLDRPQSDLASDPGLTSVWVSSPSDPPAVRFDYASGVTVVLTLWPDGKDPATSYATQREQTGGFGSLTTINGNPAYIVGQNAVPTPVTIRSSAGGSTTVSQVDPSIATVDMSIGDVDVLIRGQFSASKLVKVAESVQP
jgi:hypothetical protein